MRLLLDVNMVLDVVLDRDPWSEDAARLLSAVDEGRVEGLVAAHTVTTVHYLTERARNRTMASAAVADLLSIVDVVPVDREGLLAALALGLKDFEDGVQVISAARAGADIIVTRDARDFSETPVPVVHPAAALSFLER